MTTENIFARLMRDTGPALFFIPAGLILIAFALIMMNMKTDTFKKTTGTVISVTEAMNDENQVQYDVDTRYEVGGKSYETTFYGLSGDYRTGDSIDVYYNPDDPEKVSNSKMAGFLPPIILGVGVLAILFGIFRTVRAFKKSRKLTASDAANVLKSFDFKAYKTAAGVKEYYFRFDGNALKPGYVIEDAGRNVLYEIKMQKNNPIGARIFEFRDHLSGITAEHEVGHTTTQTYNDGFFSTSSRFKFDGTNIWDLLHERGVMLSTDLISRFPYQTYNAAKDNAPFARIEATSVYVHEDEEAAHKIAPATGHMYYRIWSDSSDFEDLFLTTFAISETEQAVVE